MYMYHKHKDAQNVPKYFKVQYIKHSLVFCLCLLVTTLHT